MSSTTIFILGQITTQTELSFSKRGIEDTLSPYKPVLTCCQDLMLTEIWHKKKQKKTLPVQFTLWFEQRRACITVKTKKKVVLLKVQHCEESFIGTSAKEEVFPLLTGSAEDQLSRSVTLSGVSRFCQVLRHPASVVPWKMELLRSNPPKQDGKKRLHSWVAQGSRFNFSWSIHF